MFNIGIYNKRKMHSLPDLNNSLFEGYGMQHIRGIIEHDVCEYFNVEVEQVRSKSSKRVYAFPRQIIMTLLIHYTDYSVVEIARFFNKKNHDCVGYAKTTIQGFLCQRANTPDKSLVNSFLYRYGYKVKEQPAASKKELVIDAYY
jgi:chromosomal replication initiation ATPase DnaA